MDRLRLIEFAFLPTSILAAIGVGLLTAIDFRPHSFLVEWSIRTSVMLLLYSGLWMYVAVLEDSGIWGTWTWDHVQEHLHFYAIVVAFGLLTGASLLIAFPEVADWLSDALRTRESATAEPQ